MVRLPQVEDRRWTNGGSEADVLKVVVTSLISCGKPGDASTCPNEGSTIEPLTTIDAATIISQVHWLAIKDFHTPIQFLIKHKPEEKYLGPLMSFLVSDNTLYEAPFPMNEDEFIQHITKAKGKAYGSRFGKHLYAVAEGGVKMHNLRVQRKHWEKKYREQGRVLEIMLKREFEKFKEFVKVYESQGIAL